MEINGIYGIDDKDFRLITNLYLHQRATVRVDNETSQEFTVSRGVRQGCILSPILFNTYSEILFRQAFSETEEGIKINGETINNLRYADNTVLIADSAEGLQKLIDRVVEACNMYGMRLNCKKTKILVVSKSDEAQYHQFRANNETLETADTITYLGCSLNEEWDHSREIRCRIEKARTVLTVLEKSYAICT